MHTLWVREHNRLADEIIATGVTDDEEIYQLARRIVGAEMQSIIYNEYLPIVIGDRASESSAGLTLDASGTSYK